MSTRTGDTVAPPPFTLVRPTTRAMPLIVCSPHSGCYYPPAFLERALFDMATLRRSEDAFVDELFAAAPDRGASLLSVQWPRSYLDVNREPYELDPAMFEDALPSFVNGSSPRVRSGFGTVPGQVAGSGPIYGAKLTFAEAEDRLERIYRPYHRALGDLVVESRAAHGFVLVLDCHSMPSTGVVLGERRAAPLADVVLGDRFGHACDEAIVAEVERGLRAAGYSVRRNDPYAGGFTTEYYGRPTEGVHALQIELNRALYMDEARIAKHAGFARVRADMGALIAALGALGRPALAAE